VGIDKVPIMTVSEVKPIIFIALDFITHTPIK